MYDIFEGKVLIKGLFLYIDTYNCDKTFFVQNYLYSQILPNDHVLYILENNCVKIIKITYRKPFYTIGICTGKTYFHTPLLSHNFNCSIPNSNPIKDHRYLLYICKDNINIIKSYNSILDRYQDHFILNDIYSNNNDIYNNLNISQNNEKKNYYTKDFQNLENLNTFNIDPVLSKDFDDAISFDIKTKKIYIHIVDANQLYLNSFVEKRAAFLSLTFYNHIQNLNMLPNNLSENKLSLICGQKRRVITVEFVIDTNADFSDNKLPILYYDIYPSTIIVKNRYNYDNVLSLESEFTYLKDLTEKYYKRRLNVIQPTYKLDDNGNLCEIFYENMNSWSHTLIEMMMINANRIVTEHMNNYNIKIPQRIHPKPISLCIDDMITGDEMIDSIIMIQKYKNASYDKDKNGHYGLNLENYTHFTSPIRRYNDVIVMRMIEGYIYENLDDLLKHINERENLNSALEKLYKKWKLMGFLQNHINNTIFDAYIVNLTKVGIKIYIKNIGYDGFIHVKFINKDIFNTLYLGQIIKIKCTKIDFTSFNDFFWELV